MGLYRDLHVGGCRSLERAAWRMEIDGIADCDTRGLPPILAVTIVGKNTCHQIAALREAGDTQGERAAGKILATPEESASAPKQFDTVQRTAAGMGERRDRHRMGLLGGSRYDLAHRMPIHRQ